MSLKTLTEVKASLDLAAVQINLALEDTGNAGQISPVVRRPGHPLRRTDQLFIIDPQTGQYSTDVSYVDSAYANPAYATTKNQKIILP